MATQSFYLLNSLQAGAGFQAMQANGTAPADAVHAAGWIMAATAAGNSAELDSGNERATNQFTSDTTTPKPLTPDNTLGNGMVIPSALTGTFAAGNWTLSLVSRSVTAAWTSGVLAYKWRVFVTQTQTGGAAREITSGAVQSPNSAAWPGTANTNVTVSTTWAAPEFSVENEFLIFTLACRIQTVSGTGNTRDVNLRVNPSSVVTTTDLGALDYQHSTRTFVPITFY